MSHPLRQPRNSTRLKRRASGGKATQRATPQQESPPDWAEALVFHQTRTVAWEGTITPLQTLSIFPKSGMFLDTIPLVRNRKRFAWEESIHPLDKERVRKQFANVQTFPFEIDYRLIDLNGAIVWVRHSLIEKAPGSDESLVRGFIKDIETEKELELESLRVSEREQNRIGQDLHDDLCQVLAGLSCLMRVIEGRITSKMPEEGPALAEINQQIIDAMHRTRALTHGLFPGKIQIADVRGALLELAEQVRARFQVEVATEFVGRFPHHLPDQTIQIYRLAQEAMSNAIRHGRASHIEVRLAAKSKTMFLTITDNGTGLGQAAEPSVDGIGMHIMRYRARTLGGEFAIGNGPKNGVIVTLQYPFQPE